MFSNECASLGIIFPPFSFRFFFLSFPNTNWFRSMMIFLCLLVKYFFKTCCLFSNVKMVQVWHRNDLSKITTQNMSYNLTDLSITLRQYLRGWPYALGCLLSGHKYSRACPWSSIIQGYFFKDSFRYRWNQKWFAMSFGLA